MAEPLADLGFEDETEQLKALGFEEEADETSRSSTTYGPEPDPNPTLPRRMGGRDIAGALLAPFGLAPPPSGLRARPSEKVPGFKASVLQGALRNYGDELAGAMAQTQADMRAIAGEGPTDPTQQTYTGERDRLRKALERYRQESPGMAMAGSVLGGVLTSPYAPTSAGAALEGAVAGVGASNELNADTIRDAAVGGLLGYAGKQAGDVVGELGGRLLQSVGQRAGGRVAAAEGKAREMAAEKVAAEIASAKGRLGSTTQEANRAVENLLRLEATGALSREQQAILANLRQSGVLPSLEQKLADAMLEQVPGAAGRVDLARAAMEGLANRAGEATEEGAKSILSGGEAKRQIMERVRRYAPTVAGSLMGAGPGGLAGYALGGSPTEALIGALAGAGIRPALRAGQRMVAHPAVQRGVYAPIQSAAQGASDVFQYAAPDVFREAGISQTDELAALADALLEEGRKKNRKDRR